MLGLLHWIMKDLELVEERVVVLDKKLKLFEDGIDPLDTRTKELFLPTVRPSMSCGYCIDTIMGHQNDINNSEEIVPHAFPIIAIPVLKVGDCTAQLVLQVTICKRSFLEGPFQTL